MIIGIMTSPTTLTASGVPDDAANLAMSVFARGSSIIRRISLCRLMAR